MTTESSRRRLRVRVSGPVYHPSENLNSSRRIRSESALSSIRPEIQPSCNSVRRPGRSPSESSLHRIRVLLVSGPVYHSSESESHGIRVRVTGGPEGTGNCSSCYGPSRWPSLFSIEIQSTLNSVRRPTRVYDPSKSSCHRIWVRVIHRKTAVIEFGSESGGQSIPRAIHGPHRTHHFKLSKFRRHPFRVARAA